MMTSMSFSISKPFKKSIFTNKVLIVVVIVLLACDISFLIVPPSNPIYYWMFHDLSFEKDGVTYYNYKWIIVAGIALNSILTYLAEKMIIDKFTVDIDKKKEAKVIDDFH